ncbi:MAG: hypothetical protein HC890_16715 [Chloroflexaceae bacterium]|nr:hypothetical protein [Chloroflexaceae bacterium]
MSTTSAQIREELIEALHLDLIGPSPDDSLHADEKLDREPSRWYLCGFLVPYEAKPSDRADSTADDEFNAPNQDKSDDDPVPETTSARKACFPSSMGLSFLITSNTTQLQVTATWGDYSPSPRPQETNDPSEDPKTDTDKTRNPLRNDFIWCRSPRQETLTVSIPSYSKPHPLEIPNSQGLQLVISVSPVSQISHLPPGPHVSLFLVNKRPPADSENRDTAYAFQTALTIRSTTSFVPRPDPRGRDTEDRDERTAYLQYRDSFEFAVGHNVSAWDERNGDRCHTIGTTWIPRAEVEKVVPASPKDLGLDENALNIEALGNIADFATLRDRSVASPNSTAPGFNNSARAWLR